MKIHYLQHVPFEGLGSIAVWAANRGDSVTVSRLYQGDALPALDTFDLLVIMGGPMSVNDESEFPFLVSEKRFIADAIQAEKRVLGICLGAQLIATVLGGTVYRNAQKEIGWFPIELTDAGHHSRFFAHVPSGAEAFHWHGETFDLPDGAAWLAQSEVCRHQAFSYRDHVVGLQFHLETTPESAMQLIVNCGDELVAAPFIQSAEAMMARPQRFAMINRLMSGLLDEFAK
ncbi:glutamine amidotransferase class-I [Candidatus Moduliflexus flocculans]|uniref:Glutamine amidotransferase class-I n=1 Tax=Candidatus Moduliflexus flocculans TaxID=1499966 RepID=A0A0S6W470_9BACT|nr:glutamine amidotransferase class-I [Candidatus Moduliflexus flocculans]